MLGVVFGLRTGVAQVAVTCVFSCLACGQGKGAGLGDGAVPDVNTDVSGDARSIDGTDDIADARLAAGCGGTAQGGGTAPDGPFTASGVNALVLQNCAAVLIDVFDGSSGATLSFRLPFPKTDAGAPFQSSGDTVLGSYYSPGFNDGRRVEVAVSITFAGSDPLATPDAGGSWGTLVGTFDTGTGTPGISISGTFSTLFCAFNKGGCSG